MTATKSNIILYIIYTLTICNILDVIYTAYLLDIGYKELNPIANYIINTYGYTGLVFFKLLPISFLYHIYEQIPQRYTSVIYWLALLFVTLNLYQLQRII